MLHGKWERRVNRVKVHPISRPLLCAGGVLLVLCVAIVFQLSFGTSFVDTDDKGTAADSATDSVEAIDAVGRFNDLTPSLPSRRSVDTGDDPLADGWRTEAFSQLASEQLDVLGRLIVSTKPISRQSVDELLMDNFVSSPLVPRSLRITYQDEVFEVRRAETETAMSQDTDRQRHKLNSLERAIAPVRSFLKDAEKVHFKFKLFRVQLDGSRATTRQYFQVSGQTPQGMREINSTWGIRWAHGTLQQKPQMESVVVEQYEQTIARTSGGPLLVDCTQSLLHGNDVFEPCLMRGIDHWRTRLEYHHGVFNFGHHGLAIGDVNGDELDDVFVCQTGGLPNHLFVQNPDGTLTDVSAEAGVDYLDNTRSALLLDLDNDDDQDLLLALTSGLLLMENDGQGHFVPRARLRSVRQAFSLSAADYNQDGHLDLYVCVYYGSGDRVSELPLPVPYFDATNGGANHLLRNHGDWKFTDATAETGLDRDNRRFSFASAWEDTDNDGDLDLLVVNDFGPNHLFRNDGGQFTDVAANVGLIDGAFGMSASFGDYDRDGFADIYVSNMFSAAGNRITFQPQFKTDINDGTRNRFRHLARGNSLFRNIGGQRFSDESVPSGVTMGRWSWGSLFADINSDGWDDLLVANGFITGSLSGDL